MSKKVSIVFEATDKDGGAGFNVYLDGLTDEERKEINAMTHDEQLAKLPRATFYALRCFQISIDALARSGAIKTMQRRG